MWKSSYLLLSVMLIGVAFKAQIAAQGPVLNGIDVLEQDRFTSLKQLTAKHGGHLRLALMTNQTGVDNRGLRTLDILVSDAAREVPGLVVVNLFSPEHGINGVLDQHDIGNDRDPATSLQVISLFGATDAQRRPTKEQLANLDAVIIDLQDVGVHFYTYETVIGYFLEAAAGTKTDIIVLDRPNPINGIDVQGLVSSPGRDNYINYTSEPVRHGMTMGELATYFKVKKQLDTQLTVVRMLGWRRSDWFDATGQLWINPSPNLRSLRQAILYPGIGLLEGTNLSVGRGTDTPFEWVGAPWIDARKTADYLNARNIPGVRFIPVQFTPRQNYSNNCADAEQLTCGQFHGQLCYGVEFFITDRNVLDSPELGLEVAAALYKLYPNTFQLDRVDRLLLNQPAIDALKGGEDPRGVTRHGEKDLQQFKRDRAAALLYK
ncbi:MAG: DUF1343 domain-containing protein [Terracidiphilus sp.]|jgi:uncharacterized protein YbbC (DUF1343 family)